MMAIAGSSLSVPGCAPGLSSDSRGWFSGAMKKPHEINKLARERTIRCTLGPVPADSREPMAKWRRPTSVMPLAFAHVRDVEPPHEHARRRFADP
jgi:hypothetical protein